MKIKKTNKQYQSVLKERKKEKSRGAKYVIQLLKADRFNSNKSVQGPFHIPNLALETSSLGTSSSSSVVHREE